MSETPLSYYWHNIYHIIKTISIQLVTQPVRPSEKDPAKPYIESEGTPKNAPGKYWGEYSKAPPLENYINIGIYSDDMKASQIEDTKNHFEKGWGYMCASTWLQCVAPHGPNADPGGDGSKENPGIRWWLEALKEMQGEYVAP